MDEEGLACFKEARNHSQCYLEDGSGGSTTPPGSPSPTPSSQPSSSPSSGPPSGCKVVNQISAWNTGLTDNMTITTSSAVNGWKLTFTLASGQTITSGWNATYSPSSGSVTATNLSYNGSLAAGGSTSIGFQATQTGNAAAPTDFMLNGSPCTSS